tara:strand:+ start:302 stop:712 length:411 start_codon:yes stop_codon:yes gene_type:complete
MVGKSDSWHLTPVSEKWDSLQIMAQHIKILALAGTWPVRAARAMIAETNSALELIEGDYLPMIYFSRDDVAIAFQDYIDKTTHCPHKGDAHYFSIITKNEPIKNVAWSYESPNPEMVQIKDHLAFYPNDKIDIEHV